MDAVTLDVIIKSAVMVPVFVEDTESVAVCKVLKLNETVHAVPVGRQGFPVSKQDTTKTNYKSTHAPPLTGPSRPA